MAGEVQDCGSGAAGAVMGLHDAVTRREKIIPRVSRSTPALSPADGGIEGCLRDKRYNIIRGLQTPNSQTQNS